MLVISMSDESSLTVILDTLTAQILIGYHSKDLTQLMVNSCVFNFRRQ